MYLQGKLNQNAHITLKALEDWQQLNLSVKNLVKELRTFDLPADKMIQTSRVRDINGILPLLLFFCFVFFLNLKHFFNECIVLFWLMNICL